MELSRPRCSVVRLALAGDVMLGRLVDQVLPHPLPDETEHGRPISGMGPMLRNTLHLTDKSEEELFERPWGSTLPVLREADLRIINLETAVASGTTKWSGKAFNYRVSPRNAVGCLKVAANINYAALANNHILDYHYDGMRETIRTLDAAGIAHAGAGEDAAEAWRPALLHHRASGLKLLALSFSDHGCCDDDEDGFDLWSASSGGGGGGGGMSGKVRGARPGLNYLPLRPGMTEDAMRELARRVGEEKEKAGAHICMVSVHWGPNYAWQPSPAIRSLARILIDGGVDGVEIYKGKPIFYGLGDFVDDYAVDYSYRNDHGMIVTLDLMAEVNLLPPGPDFEWTRRTLTNLSLQMGTAVIYAGGDTLYIKLADAPPPPASASSPTAKAVEAAATTVLPGVSAGESAPKAEHPGIPAAPRAAGPAPHA